MEPGTIVEVTKKVSEDDVTKIVEVSGDKNPIHLDEEFAKKTIFKRRVAHGLISLGLISGGLTKMFGPGNLWLDQKFVFKKPIYVGDTLTAKLKIISVDRRKVFTVETLVYNQNNEVVLDGKATSKVFPMKT